MIDLVEIEGDRLARRERWARSSTIVEIPADLRDQAAELPRTSSIETGVEQDDDADGEATSTATSPTSPTLISAASARARIGAAFSRCCAARRTRTRACSRCSTRSSTTCRARSTSRRSRASTPTGDEVDSRADRRRAVLGAGVQDHERPVRRLADLRPRLLGHAREGRRVLNSTKDKQREHRPHVLMHANNREDIDEAYAGDIVALRRPEGHHHRRHAVRSGRRRSCSSG